MAKQEISEIVPKQESGVKTDIETLVSASAKDEAIQIFQQAKARLLDVNKWHKLCGAVTATFKLTDAKGTDVNRNVQVGDFFKIDIPGPGSNTGEGFDWVQVEAIDDSKTDDDNESLTIRVRPASNPLNDKPDVAHFFSDEATSSFMVQRQKNKVSAGVHGRNEKPNTGAEAAVDKTRNTVIALGAIMGFSAAQWKSLVNGIVGK